MKRSKHTPGPWVFRTRNDDYDMNIMAENNQRLILEVPPHRSLTNEDIGNFQLIVAAPELLEALQIAMSQIKAFSTGVDSKRFALDLGKKAIAKARGEK